MWSTIVGALIKPITDIVDEFVEDKDKKNELKAKITTQIMNSSDALIRAQADIIAAEARGESWLQRSWRPLLMCLFMVMLANEYILSPWAGYFGFITPTTPLPTEMWTLLTVGVGGYVGGRSLEKAAKSWQK